MKCTQYCARKCLSTAYLSILFISFITSTSTYDEPHQLRCHSKLLPKLRRPCRNQRLHQPQRHLQHLDAQSRLINLIVNKAFYVKIGSQTSLNYKREEAMALSHPTVIVNRVRNVNLLKGCEEANKGRSRTQKGREEPKIVIFRSYKYNFISCVTNKGDVAATKAPTRPHSLPSWRHLNDGRWECHTGSCDTHRILNLKQNKKCLIRYLFYLKSTIGKPINFTKLSKKWLILQIMRSGDI